MDYKQWLQIIEIIFWIAIIMSCLLALFRGRVFAIQFIYPFLFFVFIMFNSYFQNYFLNSEVEKVFFYMQTILIILLVAVTIVLFADLNKRYLFWGIDGNNFLEIFYSILAKKDLEFKEESGRSIKINVSPDDVYLYGTLAIKEIGTSLYVKNIKKGKIDQLGIVPELKESLQGHSMSLSGKIFLILIILFSCFMLYTAYSLFI